MTWLLWALLLVLIAGSLTLLFPLAAAFVSLFHGSPKLPPAEGPIRLEVLIPAFNEAGTIRATIESITATARRLFVARPDALLGITVAFDGSTDSTRAVVRELAAKLEMDGLRFKILDRKDNQGKWATIGDLVRQSTGFWSALVDSGTLWPEDFLEKLAKALESSVAVGIAPGYEQTSGGKLSRLIWWQERMIKDFENLAGGPVSLHGATMIFRTAELRDAYRELNTRAWLNDDVVLGLQLRTRGRISYLSHVRVGDCGVRENQSEAGRRRRMAQGNIEWIQALFTLVLGDSPVVGLLALRRVMRVLWAYGFIAFLFTLGMLLGIGLYTSLACTIFICALAAFSRKLREAGWASLTAPLWMRRKAQVTWS